MRRKKRRKRMIPLNRSLKPLKIQSRRKQKGLKMLFCLPAGRKEVSRTKNQRKLTKKRKRKFASTTERGGATLECQERRKWTESGKSAPLLTQESVRNC